MASSITSRKPRIKRSPNSAGAYFERVRQLAPAYLDLLTSGTEEEFEDALTLVLERALQHLEKNKQNFNRVGEVGLTSVLAAAISIPGIITATQEANSNGHVDLTIEADSCSPSRIKLGEAKIYNGTKYHMDGMTQLLGRYTTGREMSGLLISYVRKRNIKGITARLRSELNKELPENQVGPCEDRKLKWSFATKHIHSSGEVVSLDHIGCNLAP